MPVLCYLFLVTFVLTLWLQIKEDKLTEGKPTVDWDTRSVDTKSACDSQGGETYELGLTVTCKDDKSGYTEKGQYMCLSTLCTTELEKIKVQLLKEVYSSLEEYQVDEEVFLSGQKSAVSTKSPF